MTTLQNIYVKLTFFTEDLFVLGKSSRKMSIQSVPPSHDTCTRISHFNSILKVLWSFRNFLAFSDRKNQANVMAMLCVRVFEASC